MCREGTRQKGEGRSSKPKWLCSCRSLNLPLCAAQGEMRRSPGLAPVMWRGIREMNVFRISNNHRIISTPSAFKNMDPSRLKRHFDWESKSSLPLGREDNEVAAFPLLSLYFYSHLWGDSQQEAVSRNLSLAGLNKTDFTFIFFFFSICFRLQNSQQINHTCQYFYNQNKWLGLLGGQCVSACGVALSPGHVLCNDAWHNYGMSVNT